MPSRADLIRYYLKEAIAVENSLEEKLRSFANEGDDEEVQLAFSEFADESRLHYERLTERLHTLSGEGAGEDTDLAPLLDLRPKFAQSAHVPEERLVQNLIAAFAAESGKCAMYEGLAAGARAKGDKATEALAYQIQADERRASERLFRLLPSRTKIAFNVLTAQEIDPAVETKAPENRLI